MKFLELIESIAEKWINSFLFHKLKELFGFDKRSLALFRILISIFVLYDLWDRSKDFTEHYSDVGVLPRWNAMQLTWFRNWVSIYMIGGTNVYLIILFSMHSACAFFLLLGYRTR
jgi:hypothetical protein